MIYALLLAAAAEDKGQGDAPNPLLQFVPLVLIIVVFYFMILMPAKRREKQQREMLFGSLKKNDEVLTSAGIIGTVANIKDDEVTLKVDESSNVRMRILKSSIIRILNPKEPGKDAGSDAVKAGSPP